MDLLAGLNDAQRQAATHEGGPLVVLAGPGTGKTKLIVHRVAHLILERGVKPEEIVALTFTVKACEQLRQRLADLLSQAGPSEAAKANLVNVHTYHGLGHRLVRRFADRLGLPSGSRVELIDSAQRRRLLRGLISQDWHTRSVLGQGVDAAAVSAIETIDALSDYAINPAAAKAYGAKWGEELAVNAKGLDPEALARAKAEQTIFAEVALLYDACQREQRRRGWLTFGDLITWPLAMLKSDRLARDLVRGELRHGVVDEFQDVNQATIALLEAVFPPKSDPDLCVVGDDDQAIYAFRGADDRAFARFAERWPKHTVIKLEENYRSADPVIALANATIGLADERFDPSKRVRRAAGAPDRDDAATVAVLTERNTESGDPIVAMVMGERERTPDLAWKRIAVVARGHLELDRVALALEAEGIPVNRVGGRGGGALQDQGVKDLLAWARVLVNPHDFEHARRIFLRPPVSMSGPRLLELLAAFRVARSRFEAGEGEGGAAEEPGKDGFVPWVAGQCPDDAGVQNLAATYAAFRDKLAGTPAADLMFELALRTDVVHADLLPARPRARRLASVVSLLRFVYSRQRRLGEPGDLAAFLSYFDDLDEREQEGLGEGQRVDGADPSLTESEDDAEGEGGEGGEGGVTLITAHSAKGLEFDTVFVPKVSPGLGYPSAKTREERLPAGLLDQLGAVGDAKDRRLAEERRLFYVACTRAERRLVLLGSIPKSKSDSTNFLTELVTLRPKLEALEQVDHHSVMRESRPSPEASISRELSEARSRKDRDATRYELAARARAEAAAALERAFRASVTPDELAEVDQALRDSARSLAMVAAAHATGRPPSWAAADASLRERAEAVVSAIQKGEEEGPGGLEDAAVVTPVRGPLRLSYTQVNDFERCPGCWYVKHRLKLEPTPSAEVNTGLVVHETLCEFYGRWAAADAQGSPLPTTDELLAMGRAKFFAASRGEIDRHELRRCQEMLRTAHEQLHGRDGRPVEIIERPELRVRINLSDDPRPHVIEACIDRLERHPDIPGGVRIVDYKTGQDWERLLEPSSDDLQMGIYAMAIDQLYGGEERPPVRTPGVAEYWLLATGRVGSIGLDKLNRTKIRGRIDKAIAGMLGGDYSPNPRCTVGLCKLLRPGVVVDP